MRFHSLQLKNYRGIADRTIPFKDGVNVVYGPNESGKSSIMEAIQFLFTSKATAADRYIKQITPINSSDGTEVTLCFTLNEQKYRYFKRFIKKQETILEFLDPQHSNKLGDIAHNHIETELNKMFDAHLRQALWSGQGSSVFDSGYGLEKSTSLIGILQNIGGTGSQNSATDAQLIKKAKAEYNVYFTDGGREKKIASNLETLKAKVKELQDKVADLTNAIQALDDEQTKAIKLGNDLKNAEDDLGQKNQTLQRLNKAWQDLNDAKREQENKQLILDGAQRTSDDRNKFIKDLQQANQLKTNIENEIATLISEITDLTNQINVLNQQMQAKVNEILQKKSEIAKLQSTESALQDKQELEKLEKDLTAIKDCEDKMNEANEELKKIKITKVIFDEIKRLNEEIRTIEIQLNAEAAKVTLTATQPVTALVVGNETLNMNANEQKQIDVKEPLQITHAGLKIEITVGNSAQELQTKLQELSKQYDELCSSVDVADFAGAEQALEKLNEYTRIKEDSEGNLRRILDGKQKLDLENLKNRLKSNLEAFEKQYPSEYDQLLKRSLLDVRSELNQLRSDLTTVETLKDQLQTDLNTKNQEKVANQTSLGNKQTDLNSIVNTIAKLTNDLANARNQISDADVQSQLQEAQTALNQANINLTNKQKVYDDMVAEINMNPSQLQQAILGIQATIQTLTSDLQTANNEIIRLTTTIDNASKEDPQEALLVAESQLKTEQTRVDRIKEKANAIRLIYLTLEEIQKQVQSQFRAPLDKEMNELAKHVFGPHSSIALNDSLGILSRTVEGQTLEYGMLSHGTKEQLSIMLRLAAGKISANSTSLTNGIKAEGLPIFLDDTLGYADVDRLKGMGDLFDNVGQSAQVIVLTCNKERFDAITNAERIDIVNLA